ncbi:MAG: CHASE4 domain-containing protein, partial [Candidatus Omnitrophica bacterium]|nr:CHASE4 domain-containing protein [Candidatus Omnitrophota bacterium]
MKKRTVVEIFKNQLEEKKDNFNSVVNLGGIPLESYINDYTGDEMVRFLEKPDKEWAHTNIYEGLNSLYLNAAWVYSSDRYLVYSVNNLNDEKLQTVPLPKEAFDRIHERKKFCHFFVDTPHGLMEICAATIYPSSDPAKKEQPKGYFVAGKLWDSAYMNFISRLTDTSLEIVPNKENLPKTLNDPEMGVIYFLKPLRTWNHSEIANIKVKVSSPTVRTINRAIRVDFILFLFFITIMLGSSLFYVAYWILSPLFTISLALKESAPIHLMPLTTLKNEFGDISRLIDDFFKQKEEIKKAYDELKDTQSQLIQAEKMKVIGTLASGLAHEVRNRLGIIMLGIDLLEQEIGPDKLEWL